MKKIVIFISALILATGITVFGQDQQTASAAGQSVTKQSQPTKAKIEVNQLPKAAQDYLMKNYPEKKVDQAWKVTEASGIVSYHVEIGSMAIHFDSMGKFLKEAKKDEKSGSELKLEKDQPEPYPDKSKETTDPPKK